MATWFLRRRRTTPLSHRGRWLPAVERLEERCLPAQITEFNATAGSHPAGITQAADGNLWFTEFQGSALGRITPSGTVTDFPLPSAGRKPDSITSGPNGLLYFTEAATSEIGRINPLAGSDAAIQDSLTESAVVPAGAGAAPFGITAGPDGNLWFAELLASNIAHITPDLATIKEIPTPTADAHPDAIATGPDRALWFTEALTDKIGRITTGGTVTNEFSLPQAGSDPEGITAGPDGNLWFTERGKDQVGQISPSGALHEFPLTSLRQPVGITPGPDGNLWFAEIGADQIGRISPAGALTEYGTGITQGGGPLQITDGPDGNLWFTEEPGDRIGRLIPDLSARGTPVTAIATVPFSGPVASLTDPNPVAGGFAVTIDWGDGTPLDTTSGSVTAVPNQPGHFAVNGAHTYAGGASASATITVTITDTSSGTSATAASPATVVPFADSVFLAVTETGPSRATAGEDVTYTLTMTNSGPADAQDVTLTDAVPDGTTFVSAEQLTGPTFTLITPPVGGTGTFVADPVALAAGQSATFRVVFHAVATGPLINAVTVTTSTPNRNPNPGLPILIPVPVQLTLSGATLADGSPAGTAVGTVTVTLPDPVYGQFLPPLFSLPAGEADNALFTLAAGAAGEVLVAGFRACSATRASYQVRMHVDVGFGDSSTVLPVSVAPAAVSPCQSGPAPAPVLGGVQVVRGGKQGQVQELVLTFGAALDPTSAGSLRHYTIVLGSTGKGKKRKAITAPLLGAVYDPVRETVTLRLGKVKGPKLRGTLTIEGLMGLGGVPGDVATVPVDLRPKPSHKH
jgi:virginiamycin B lyase